MRVVAVVVVGLVLLGSVVALRHSQANAAGSCDASSTETAVEQQLVGLINGYRAANGLPSLSVSPVLSRSAHWFANDLVSHGLFQHEPDSLGRSFVTRSHDCGVSGYFGENLAVGGATAAQTLGQWEGSPPHNAALLNSRFTSIGVAVDGAMWVADFGSAQNDSAPPPTQQTPTKSPTAVPTPTMTPTPPSSPTCASCWWRGHAPEIGSG